MTNIPGRTKHLKIILSILWLLFTSALVAWWCFYVLTKTPDVTETEFLKHQRMIFWEGLTMHAAILIGGAFLIFYSLKDQKRHERLQFFFSQFSHDIRTSIARLRLQGDILEEEMQTHPDQIADVARNKILKRLLRDISQLDLQLENSLLLTHIDTSGLVIEDLRISEVAESLKNIFPMMNVKLEGDAEVQADVRALKSVFNNLLDNALKHGSATEVLIRVETTNQQVKLTVADNGSGSYLPTRELGREILFSQSIKGTGIGLYLVTRLIHKMRGHVQFKNLNGFICEIQLIGKVIS